MITWLF